MGDGGGIAGVDVGATLTKLALPQGGSCRFESLPSERPERVCEALADHAPTRIGLTGGGANRLAARLRETVCVDEFRAWHAGVAELLPAARRDERFLLVSLGTGTSVLLVEGSSVKRLGGTPLGGGTVLGLGHALTGSACFEELCALAAAGDRARVDLSVAEVYRGSEAPLAGDVMASSFARLAEGPHFRGGARREDLARSLMAMVGENVALVVGTFSLLVGVECVVFGGSTLRGNPALTDALSDYLERFGRTPTYLDDGAFAGALGARRLARRAAA